MKTKKIFVGLGLVLAAIGLTGLFAATTRKQSNNQHRAGDGQNLMRQMMRTMMSGVVPPGVTPGSLPAPQSEGAKLVATYCVQCHSLPSPRMHSAAEWPGVASRMFQRMTMCSQMSRSGMMGNMGSMGMRRMAGNMGGGGMMGMMGVKAPSAKEQKMIVSYLEEHSLKSIQPSAVPSPRSRGAILFAATCAQCHALPDPNLYAARQWPQVVARMRKNMVAMGKPVPGAATLRTITEFLQNMAQKRR